MRTASLCRRFLVLPIALGFAMGAAAEPKLATFHGATPEFRWPLKELNPDLPSDWSSYRFLTLELRSSTAQRFELRLYTSTGLRHIRLQPFQGAWIRAAIPLTYFERPDREGFDLASLGNKSRTGYWINLLGSYGPLNDVQAIGLAMQNPIGSPTVEIRSAQLDKESPGDAVLGPKPLVDEFGQWIHADWPGKANSLVDLKRAWAAEDAGLKPGNFDYCEYGGYKNTKAKATGFFHVEQIDGRWWFVDPDGHLFFSTGADVMTPWMGTRTQDREGVFAALPPADLTSPALRPGRESMASFYTWNLGLRFGSTPSEAMLRASHGFDVFSMNSYGYEVNQRRLDEAYRVTGKPILIGEFHFGTPGRGLAAGLVQCASQEERGVAYRYYVEHAAANPAIIGVHWFEWVDEPNTGRFDGENYNIGFVDVTDRPYEELVDAAKITHARLYEVHAGKTAPVSRRARAE